MEIEKRGLHNWKNLFKKPTGNEMIIFVLLLLTFFNVWAYNRDMQACRDFYEANACEICSPPLESSIEDGFLNLTVSMEENIGNYTSEG